MRISTQTFRETSLFAVFRLSLLVSRALVICEFRILTISSYFNEKSVQRIFPQCSATCGVGRRFRQVDCRFPNGTVLYFHSRVTKDRSTPQLLPKRRRIHSAAFGSYFIGLRCPEPRPVDKTECQLGPCQENRPFWWPIVSSAVSLP